MLDICKSIIDRIGSFNKNFHFIKPFLKRSKSLPLKNILLRSLRTCPTQGGGDNFAMALICFLFENYVLFMKWNNLKQPKIVFLSIDPKM